MKPIAMFEKPNPLPKYFAIDIDGTFYTRNEDIYKSNVDAFKMVMDKGVIPFFCTGRNIVSTRNLVGEYFSSLTGFRGYPGVYMNGTLVYDTEGNLIKIETFSTDLLDKFIKFITEKGMESEAAFYEVTKSFSLHPLSEKVIAYLNTNKVPVPEVVSIDTLMTKNIVLIAFPPIDIDIEGVKNGVDYNYKQSDEYVVCITPGILVLVLYVHCGNIANFVKPNTPPKYFAIDVDGTFYVENESIFRKNVDAFKLLKEKNITPILCTARGPGPTRKLIGSQFLGDMDYEGYPGVYNNGAVVYDSDGNLIKIEKFSEDFLNKFKAYTTENGFNSRVINEVTCVKYNKGNLY
ncbi:hydrolase [Theileria orientalis strain Shintoku]|uniref:Hydrolase n=1 Tax=Theileria orientalis strain Shintoku TaxID=869250 RepID=J4D6G7_THEOR|nr:hydrolase [Theileria orientalis strain Shintoku]BAM39565.1 hydrolase [Theileria orientalis strain Shintoku]|eukprot:XP_009689866.1 hydrolase [Theileria orientalis strain Shintoku]